MAAGDPEDPGRPDYKVYRGGSGRGRRSKSREKSTPSKRGSQPREPREGGSGDDPSYRVYRSRRNPLAKLRGADLGSMREKLGERRKSGRRDEVERERFPDEKPTWRKVLRWTVIAAACWFVLSVVLFAVSAQIQKGKLNDGAADALGFSSPLMIASGQTILVIGTDARPEGSNEGGAETQPKCLEGAAQGDPPDPGCQPFRADTLMLVRAGGGAFEKLSIPRDVYAEIPGQSSQKINAAYAFGGAALQIETVEGFLGIEIDHVVILDFAGFADFIDAIGGVKVNLPDRVKAKISGGSSNGGITLKLDRGESTLDGEQALALARVRNNLRNPSEDDTDRARRQQLILQGIKNRMTSPWRAPINFLRGPLIAWNAPKAMVSDMGGLMLPQLALSSAIGGDSGTKILKPTGPGPGGSLSVPVANCEKAVRQFLGEAGPEPPICSPLG